MRTVVAKFGGTSLSDAGQFKKIKEIIKLTDAVVLTHMHSDHFDDEAAESLPKDIDFFVQNEDDKRSVAFVG